MKEKTVNFDDKNSFIDYGLIFASVNIGPPAPQISRVEVPFRNGSLDVTDNFGDMKYNDRTISMNFLIPWWVKDQLGVYSRFMNEVNGLRKKITLSADPEWYYLGRPEVGEASIQNGFWSFPVEITVDPYKYKDVFIEQEISDEYTFNLYNDYMKTIPVFNSDGPMNLEFNTNYYAWTGGKYVTPSITLVKGNNELIARVDNTTTLTISYRQGRL